MVALLRVGLVRSLSRSHFCLHPQQDNLDKRRFGRKNITVLATLSEVEAADAWSKARHCVQITELGCHVYTGSNQNGYPSLSRGHAKSKIKLHMLAYFVAHDVYPASDQVVSHLCHNKMCINKDHLVIESISKNSRRNGCLHRLATESGAWNLCPHQPRCLARDVGNLPGEFAPTVVP
jgi:hypothetical protein